MCGLTDVELRIVRRVLLLKDNPLFIRRVKEDLKNFEGEPLFLPRHDGKIPYELER